LQLRDEGRGNESKKVKWGRFQGIPSLAAKCFMNSGVTLGMMMEICFSHIQ